MEHKIKNNNLPAPHTTFGCWASKFMMKKFWQFMGVSYLFMIKRRKVIVGLIVAILIVGQLFLSIWLVVGQEKIKKDMKKNQDNTTKLINKTYSQTWQINTKLNQQEQAAKPKK